MEQAQYKDLSTMSREEWDKINQWRNIQGETHTIERQGPLAYQPRTETGRDLARKLQASMQASARRYDTTAQEIYRAKRPGLGPAQMQESPQGPAVDATGLGVSRQLDSSKSTSPEEVGNEMQNREHLQENQEGQQTLPQDHLMEDVQSQEPANSTDRPDIIMQADGSEKGIPEIAMTGLPSSTPPRVDLDSVGEELVEVPTLPGPRAEEVAQEQNVETSIQEPIPPDETLDMEVETVRQEDIDMDPAEGMETPSRQVDRRENGQPQRKRKRQTERKHLPEWLDREVGQEVQVQRTKPGLRTRLIRSKWGKY
jgi:hypothetical protein